MLGTLNYLDLFSWLRTEGLWFLIFGTCSTPTHKQPNTHNKIRFTDKKHLYKKPTSIYPTQKPVQVLPVTS